MCDQKRCSAPIKGKRCPNFTVDSNKFHCEDHITKALALNNRYQILSKKMENYSIEHISKYKTTKEKIRYLYEYYCLIISVYKYRMLHRDYAFIPTLFDPGHEKQYTILPEKTVQVENVLSQLYIQYIEELTVSSIKEETTPKEIEEVEIAMEKVRTFKKKRIDHYKLVENTLNKYIRENKKLKEDTDTIVNQCVDMLTKLAKLCKLTEDNTCYHKLFGLYHLIGRLHEMGYFVDNYTPSRCCDKCNDILLHELKITCDCVNEHDNIRDFLYDIHIDSLKSFHEILQHNKLSIKYICKDYNSLWNESSFTIEDGFVFTDMKYTLIWSEELHRLTIKTQDQIEVLLEGKKQHRQIDKKHNRFSTSYSELTSSIMRKWKSQSSFIRFVDGNTGNIHPDNLKYVSIKDAMKNIDTWKVDWDMDLTRAEIQQVRSKSWRKGLLFE